MQTVVLAWGESSYDLSQLSRMLWQLVHGARGSSNNVVVVLTQARCQLLLYLLAVSASSCCGLVVISWCCLCVGLRGTPYA